MGIALPETGTPAAAGRSRARRWTAHRAGILLCFGYLVASLALNWRLWAGLGTMAPAGDPGQADNDLYAWSLRYVAEAIAHGHLPALVTAAMNPPRGVSLLWNATILFPATVLTPVTLLGGPQVSITVMLTLGYAGTAAATYWLLRRYGASVLAGGLGGAVFGFSPALLDSGTGHVNMQFAVLLPLIVEAALRIVTGRARAAGGRRGLLLAGIWLGLLVAAQLFTEEEMLTDSVLTCLGLVAVVAASRPRAALSRLADAATGLGAAAATTLLICGYALWTQFRGPLSEHGSPYLNAKFANSPGAFVNPSAGLLFHTASSAAYATSHGAASAEYVAYLGWPLLVLVVLATVRYWRDLRVRAAGITWGALELLSLGGHRVLLPFHWLQGLPLLVEMLPDRLSILAVGAAAGVLAFALDLSRAGRPLTAEPRTAGSPTAGAATAQPWGAGSWIAGPPTGAPGASGAGTGEPGTGGQAGRTGRGLARGAVPVAVAVLAVLPLVPRPVAAVATGAVPAGWGDVFTGLRLAPGASVLVVPPPSSHQSAAMRWQAATGEPAELVAGWFIGPNASGRAITEYWGPPFTSTAVRCLDALAAGTPTSRSGCAAALRPALAYWHPAAVVAAASPGTPLGRFLVTVLGQPAVHDGDLLAWRR